MCECKSFIIKRYIYCIYTPYTLYTHNIGLGPSSKGLETNLKLSTNKIAWIHWSLDLGPLSKVSLNLASRQTHVLLENMPFSGANNICAIQRWFGFMVKLLHIHTWWIILHGSHALLLQETFFLLYLYFSFGHILCNQNCFYVHINFDTNIYLIGILYNGLNKSRVDHN